MNAEIFEKKEYADSVARVDFVRVKDLQKSQEFLMNGVWWVVHSITKDKVYYYNKSLSKGRQKYFGAKNQMFVQVAK